MKQHFFSEPCVILEYLVLWYIQNLRNIQKPVKRLWYNVFFKTLRNLDIFRTLIYSDPRHILKPRYIQNPVNIYSELIYAEPFVTMVYLDSWYIQNLSKFRIQDIQNTVNL